MIVRFSQLSALLAILLMFMCGTSLALELIYPTDKSYIGKSNYLIVKAGDPNVNGISVEINGVKSDIIDISSPEYKKYFGDMLILQPDFDYGVNRILVESFQGRRTVGTVGAEVYYRKDGELLSSDQGFRPFVMHTQAKEAKCSQCHNMNPGQAALDDPSPSRNPCASCHLRMLSKKHVHGPAGVLECGNCHDAGSTPEKYRPTNENIGVVCNECHEDKVEEFKARPYVHGPVEAGYCTVCHDAHASNYPAQLLAPVNQLCMSCHAAITEAHVVRGVITGYHPLKGDVNPANPEKPFNCASCHDPHAGLSDKYFQGAATSRFNLCQLCHKK